MKQLLETLRQGDAVEAFEAAKSLSNLPRLPVKQLVEILRETKDVHNRAATVYALSWLFRRDRNESLRALLNICNDANENPFVRAYALEGLGMQRPTKRHKLWLEVEKAILCGLLDEAVEVRFWACYAAGTLRMKSALPRLRELSRHDSAVCPNWWLISEEATDAIEWVGGRTTQSRLPISSSN
jgi:HEAT repeat protein